MASGARGPNVPNITTLEALLVASQFGVTLAVAVGLGLFVGSWLDGRLGTSFIFMLIGVFLGLASATFSTVRFYRAFLRRAALRNPNATDNDDSNASDPSSDR